jgi:pimeloyl-ACP methyl ester carboxylesterase
VEQRCVNVGGQLISYLESSGGGTGRAVIFVHGNSSSARTWLPVLAGGFGQRLRCLALDLPGHGQSEPASDQADYSLPGYAAVLAGFAKALGAADAAIIGWSVSDLLSDPQLSRVRGMVLGVWFPLGRGGMGVPVEARA